MVPPFCTERRLLWLARPPRWFLLALEHGSDDEGEEIGMLERREPHHSPISVVSLRAPPEPMSGTKNRPLLVEESLGPHYIIVEDSLAPRYIVVQEPPVPMSRVKHRPCLVVQSLGKPADDRATTTSPVPISGKKDQPFLVDDPPAVPKVNNLCLGGENPLEGGSATHPINLVSPPSATVPVGDAEPRVLPT